jgi:anti-sigma B factor antagonist
MQLERRYANDVSIITVSGRMTGLDTPGQLKEQVVAALAAGERSILLNLAQVSFVDSSFIGELVSCCISVARVGGTLKIASPVRRVQELLLITRLTTIIESYESEAAGIASFRRTTH